MDRTQGTSHFNAVAFDGAVGTIITAGTIDGINSVVGSTISGSTLTLPSGMPGVAQVISGTTAAVNATMSGTHGLGATPSHVSISNYSGSGVITVRETGTGQILVSSSLGTQAWSAIIWK